MASGPFGLHVDSQPQNREPSAECRRLRRRIPSIGPVDSSDFASSSGQENGTGYGDGSLYVGDFNLVRKVTPEGRVFTVLHLPTGQVSYSYYLAVSPIDGSLYLSDCERKQILRVAAVIEDQILNPSSASSLARLDNNYEVVVGSGEPCLPADPEMCGDGRPALEAQL